MLSSECFITLGVLLAFMRNFSFIQANASTGPLLHAFIRMLIDVAKFFLYFVFVFVAFAISFTKLYHQYVAAKAFLQQNITVSYSLNLARCLKLIYIQHVNILFSKKIQGELVSRSTHSLKATIKSFASGFVCFARPDSQKLNSDLVLLFRLEISRIYCLSFFRNMHVMCSLFAFSEKKF